MMDFSEVTNTKMMFKGERKLNPIEIHCPIDTYAALKKFHSKRQEHFIVLTMNGSNSVIAIRIITIGIVNRTLVHPREVFIHAIKDNAVGIILAHNHPSGNTNPSIEDSDITDRLVQAGELLGFKVIDHIIFCKYGYYSFLEKGQINRFYSPDKPLEG
jgi:DNA repair protein RadC